MKSCLKFLNIDVKEYDILEIAWLHLFYAVSSHERTLRTILSQHILSETNTVFIWIGQGLALYLKRVINLTGNRVEGGAATRDRKPGDKKKSPSLWFPVPSKS